MDLFCLRPYLCAQLFVLLSSIFPISMSSVINIVDSGSVVSVSSSASGVSISFSTVWFTFFTLCDCLFAFVRIVSFVAGVVALLTYTFLQSGLVSYGCYIGIFYWAVVVVAWCN